MYKCSALSIQAKIVLMILNFLITDFSTDWQVQIVGYFAYILAELFYNTILISKLTTLSKKCLMLWVRIMILH